MKNHRSILVAAAAIPLLLAGCGGGGGGGGSSSSSTSTTTPTVPAVQSAFASGTAGYWQVDTIDLNNQIEADKDVTENFTTRRISASQVKYADSSVLPVTFDSGDGKLTPPSLTYGKSYLSSRLIDPNGNYQDESDPSAWSSGSTAPKTGWLSVATDSLMAGQWYREFTVKSSGPGAGKVFKVKTSVVRGMAASSEGALQQMGYLDNKAKVTIFPQNDVTAEERSLLGRYFNLTDPTANYLQESNNKAAGAVPYSSGSYFTGGADGGATHYVEGSAAKYRMLVNGKDCGADLAILTQNNGAIQNTVETSGSMKVMPGLIANGGLIVVKYPNRLLAVLYPAGYRVVEDTSTFKKSDITNLGTGKLGNTQIIGTNGVAYDGNAAVDDFDYVPYAFVPNFYVGSYDNSYKYANLVWNNGGDGFRNIVTYMDGNFTETLQAQLVKSLGGLDDATISSLSAKTSTAAFGWNPYRVRNALRAAGKTDAGFSGVNAQNFSVTPLSDQDYYNAPQGIAAAKWAWIGASLPSSSDVGIELNRYLSGYDPRKIIFGLNGGADSAGAYQIGKVSSSSGLNVGASTQQFGISSWSFATVNNANNTGGYAATNDKLSVDWANATLMSSTQASSQVNWNKLLKANATMTVGVQSVEGSAYNAQATIKGSIQYLDHIAIYDSVPSVNHADLGATKVTNLNDIYASPALPPSH